MTAHPNNPVRGFSRYRLAVTLAQAGPRPYGWEINDEVADRRVRRSTEHYRTPKAAWEAGSKVLAELGMCNATAA